MIDIRKILMLLILLLGFVYIAPGAEAAELSSKAGAVTTASGNLNVRSHPSAGAAVVATLRKGSYITLMEKTGSWWRVEYGKGKYGYCHTDYITVVQGTPVTVTTASGSLNIRSGAGTNYERVGSAAKGEVVIFLREKNGWSRILYHGTKTGYVSGQYLSNYYKAVSLAVPSYKQTDPRWAEQILGTSGKTFAQIGCATTAIAMMESYRTGKTVLPDAMSRQLRYTDAGDVYWPGHFKTVTAYSLRGIYDRVKGGKPVLLGATNAYGSQHWVVITGFSGGISLSAEKFSVLDPGTYSRTSLKQFLDAYPNFYKYFYY